MTYEPPVDPAAPTPGVDRDNTVVTWELEKLDRSESEAHLLALARVDPVARDRLRDVLIAYAMPVISSWISSGQMWKEATKIGVPAPLPGLLPIEPEEITSLAAEVVVRAYNRFTRSGLKDWSQTGGKSLRAWFVNDCKYQFANAVRAWSKDRGALTPGRDCSLGVDDMDLDSVPHRPVFGYDHPIAPDAVVVERMELDRWLRQIESRLGPRERRVFEQHLLHRRSFAEIGRELRMSDYVISKMYKKSLILVRRLWEEE